MPSAQHERITAMSSTHSAVCGSQSETQMPLWPCCFHARFEPSSGELCSPIEVSTLPKLSGKRWPASSLSFGFGSKRSMWLGPPSMKRKITLLAFAGKCPDFAARGLVGFVAPGNLSADIKYVSARSEERRVG